MIQHAATEEQMIELGRQSAGLAAPGAVICLSGSLGAGKTHWTKGLVSGLGSSAAVTSPTFGLIHEYSDGRIPVFHFDLYRLDSQEELLAMGWDEFLERDGVVVVEWADRFPELMPADALRITITTLEDGTRMVETLP